jgi:hypothetical protein
MTQTCHKCGGIVRIDRTACPACGALIVRKHSDEPSAPALKPPSDKPPTGDALRTEIRARAMWGEKAYQIRKDYERQGANPVEVNRAIQEAIALRVGHFRKRGLRDLAFGIVSGTLGGLGIFVLYDAQETGTPVRFSVRGLLFIVIASIAGMVLTVRGITRLRRGGSDEGAASDLEGDGL